MKVDEAKELFSKIKNILAGIDGHVIDGGLQIQVLSLEKKLNEIENCIMEYFKTIK